MSRYEKATTMITSNRSIDDWGLLMGDVVVVAPLLDRLMHHGHILKFDGKNWRLKEVAERMAQSPSVFSANRDQGWKRRPCAKDQSYDEMRQLVRQRARESN
jgi:hypothetical protein